MTDDRGNRAAQLFVRDRHLEDKSDEWLLRLAEDRFSGAMGSAAGDISYAALIKELAFRLRRATQK